MSFNPEVDVAVLTEVAAERAAQDRKWGQQDHLDGTGTKYFEAMRDYARVRCQSAFADGEGTWEHIATEEYFEALAETDEVKLRGELVQLSAVLVAWIGAIDRRG